MYLRPRDFIKLVGQVWVCACALVFSLCASANSKQSCCLVSWASYQTLFVVLVPVHICNLCEMPLDCLLWHPWLIVLVWEFSPPQLHSPTIRIREYEAFLLFLHTLIIQKDSTEELVLESSHSSECRAHRPLVTLLISLPDANSKVNAGCKQVKVIDRGGDLRIKFGIMKSPPDTAHWLLVLDEHRLQRNIPQASWLLWILQI